MITNKTLLIISIIVIFYKSDIRAQQSITSIFSTSKKVIDSLEKTKLKIDHVGFNILTLNDNVEDTRYHFEKSNEYTLLAFGSKNFKKLKIELYDSNKDEGKRIRTGKPYKSKSNASHLIFAPEKSDSLLVKVIGEEFTNGKSNGRYYFVVGKRKVFKPLIFKTRQKEEVYFNTNTKKIKSKKKDSFASTFTVTKNKVIHNYSSTTNNYSIIKNSTTERDLVKGNVIYEIMDTIGVRFNMTISSADNTIMILPIVVQGGEVTNGQRYYYTTNY